MEGRLCWNLVRHWHRCRHERLNNLHDPPPCYPARHSPYECTHAIPTSTVKRCSSMETRHQPGPPRDPETRSTSRTRLPTSHWWHPIEKSLGSSRENLCKDPPTSWAACDFGFRLSRIRAAAQSIDEPMSPFNVLSQPGCDVTDASGVAVVDIAQSGVTQ